MNRFTSVLAAVAIAALGAFSMTAVGAPATVPQLQAQIRKERVAHQLEVANLKHALRAKYEVNTLEAIRFGAVVTGGSYSQGKALVSCETGGTFAPGLINPVALGGSHASYLWQWLMDSWRSPSLNPKYHTFDPANPFIQSVASFDLRARSGSWFNAWKDICGTRADAS